MINTRHENITLSGTALAAGLANTPAASAVPLKNRTMNIHSA